MTRRTLIEKIERQVLAFAGRDFCALPLSELPFSGVAHTHVETGYDQLDLFRLGAWNGEMYEIVRLAPSTLYPEHRHMNSDSQLYIFKGEGILLREGKHLPYRPGKVFDIPRGTGHGFETDERETLLLSIQNPPIMDAGTGEIDIVY